MGNYIENHKEKIQKTPGGTLCQVFGVKEGASCSVALVKMDENSNGIKHYHDNITEIYLFSKGNGIININEHKNIINEGDCYIIPPNNTHYIQANTEMKFACICTPPWTKTHEISVSNRVNGNNILRETKVGILQILGNESEHNIKMYETSNCFIPNENMKKYRRVYYFITGNGIINIDNKEYNIESGNCYDINQYSNEFIKPIGILKFALVCDRVK